MITYTPSNEDDNLRRIAEALERIADAYAFNAKPITINTTFSGDYAGSKDQLVKAVNETIRKAVKDGKIPPHWVAGAA